MPFDIALQDLTPAIVLTSMVEPGGEPGLPTALVPVIQSLLAFMNPLYPVQVSVSGQLDDAQKLWIEIKIRNTQ